MVLPNLWSLPKIPKRAKVLAGILLTFIFVPVLAVASSEELEFLLGGVFIDLGYRFQDPIHPPDELTPSSIWTELLAHNGLAADVREAFPRSTHHPIVAIVVCMDARIDTNEIVGDTRRYYYVLRLAGSVMSEREEEMLELAVDNGVRVIVLTTHTECAAERVAAEPELRARYPNLATSVDERAERRAEFLARPIIAARIREGALRVEEARIDTRTGRLSTETSHVAGATP